MHGRKALTLAALACATVALLASPAAAHSVTAEGSSECSDGEHVVTWSIHNSEQAKRMVTTLAANTGETSPQGLVIPSPQGTGSAQTIVEGDYTGTVALTVTADWYDGNGTATTHHFGPRLVIARVELESECTPTPPTTQPPCEDCTPNTTVTVPPPSVPPAPPVQPPAAPPVPPAATPPAELPHTGSTSLPLALVAGGLIVAGAALGLRPRRTA